jgi:hypothetical protein
VTEKDQQEMSRLSSITDKPLKKKVESRTEVEILEAEIERIDQTDIL